MSDRYIRTDLKPLKKNPFTDLINAYINSRSYVSNPIFETQEAFEYMEIPRGGDLTGVREAGWINYQIDDVKSYWKRSIGYETVQIKRGPGGGVPYEPGVTESEEDFEVYFPLRDGYTIDYINGVAFQIPALWQIDEFNTYTFWKRHPEHRNAVVLIYPSHSLLSWLPIAATIEADAVHYTKMVMWVCRDNIAFANKNLSENIPDYHGPNLIAYGNPNMSFFPTVRLKPVRSIDGLPDQDFNPINGKLRGTQLQIVSMFLKMIGLTVYGSRTFSAKKSFFGSNIQVSRVFHDGGV